MSNPNHGITSHGNARLGRWITALANVVVVGPLVLSGIILVGPYAGRCPGVVGLVFENAGNFLGLGIASALGSLLFRRTRPVILAALLLVSVCCILIVRYQWPAAAPPPGPTSPTWTILYANLGWPSRAGALLPYIDETNPDFILLVEYDPEAEQILESLSARYPYKLVEIHPRPDCFGMALYSRVPGDSVLGFPDPLMPVPAIRFSPAAAPFDLWNVHTLPPKTPEQREARDRYLAAVSQGVLRAGKPALVVGDLNTTERSRSFQDLLHAGLRDSRDGRGWSPSWLPFLEPLAWLNPIFSIPLDHALVYGDIEVSDRRLGPDFGSDHLPLLLRIERR